MQSIWAFTAYTIRNFRQIMEQRTGKYSSSDRLVNAGVRLELDDHQYGLRRAKVHNSERGFGSKNHTKNSVPHLYFAKKKLVPHEYEVIADGFVLNERRSFVYLALQSVLLTNKYSLKLCKIWVQTSKFELSSGLLKMSQLLCTQKPVSHELV